MIGLRVISLALLFLLAGCGTPDLAAQPAPTVQATSRSAPLQTAAPSSTPSLVMPTPTPASTVTPRITMGGGRIVYTRGANGQGSDGGGWSELWRMNSDGSDDRKLTACPNGCRIDRLFAAPNGAAIAYITIGRGDVGQLRIVNIDGTNDRLLLDQIDLYFRWSGAYTFSPDGTQLAFLRQRSTGELVGVGDGGQEGSIWVVATNSGAPRQITEWSRSAEPHVWAYADHLLYTDNVILRVPVDGKQPPERVATGRLAAISPDRTLLLTWLQPSDSDMAIVYTTPSQFGVVALDRDPPQLINTLQLPAQPLAWSPDGTRLAQIRRGNIELVRRDDGTRTVMTAYKQELTKADGTPLKEMGDGVVDNLLWTPDGRGLLYLAGQPDLPARFRLQYLNLADGRERTIRQNFPASFVVVP